MPSGALIDSGATQQTAGRVAHVAAQRHRVVDRAGVHRTVVAPDVAVAEQPAPAPLELGRVRLGVVSQVSDVLQHAVLPTVVGRLRIAEPIRLGTCCGLDEPDAAREAVGLEDGGAHMADYGSTEPVGSSTGGFVDGVVDTYEQIAAVRREALPSGATTHWS